MKNNFKKLIVLLPVLPMLMANSPVPAPHPSSYKDFSISISDIKKHPKDVLYYQYSYDLNNTGEGYITYIYIDYRTKDNKYDSDILDGSALDSIFYESVIIPHQEVTLLGKNTILEPSIDNYEKITYSAFAYSDFADDVTVTGDYSLTKATYSSNTYEVNISLEGTDKKGFYYGVVFKITYDDEVHYVHAEEHDQFAIRVMEDFDLTKLTKIELYKITKTAAYDNHLDEIVYGVFFTFLTPL